jgi:hypothetical protein
MYISLLTELWVLGATANYKHRAPDGAQDLRAVGSSRFTSTVEFGRAAYELLESIIR